VGIVVEGSQSRLAHGRHTSQGAQGSHVGHGSHAAHARQGLHSLAVGQGGSRARHVQYVAQAGHAPAAGRPTVLHSGHVAHVVQVEHVAHVAHGAHIIHWPPLHGGHGVHGAHGAICAHGAHGAPHRNCFAAENIPHRIYRSALRGSFAQNKIRPK